MKLLYKSSAMESLRKWFYKPKRDDRSLLAQFFFADETLNMVAAELDSFDGREDPERCSTLVNQLRHAQEHVLNITNQIMDQLLGTERVARGFRVKFPEDVLQENLAGQLWFGAECLAAGSSIMNREEESTAMRPLAKALTRSLETVRALLREHCLRCNQYGASLISCCSEMLHESLKIFDRLFAEFELCYVSAMVPVKTPKEFEAQQFICVLFSETLQRARKIGLLTQEQVDDYDPALMFAIPRLAIVSGLLIYPSGPLSIDKSSDHMSDMFRPFRILLQTIKQLLMTLDKRELYLLEKLLCTNEEIANIRSSVETNPDGTLNLGVEADCYPDISEFVTKFYSDNAHCRDVMMNQMVGCEWGAPGASGQYNSDDTSREDYKEKKRKSVLVEDETAQLKSNIPCENSPNANVQSFADVEINLDCGETNIEKDLHCRTDDVIRLSVRAVDDDSPTEGKENELESVQDSLSTTLPIIERRNSNRSIASSRKSSRNESIGSSNHGEHLVRNLSHNGLSMFDPLAAASTSSVNINPIPSDNNVLIPDQMLISNLSDQVSEIADKLSHITYGEIPENSLDNMRNFSLMDSSLSNLLQDQLSGQIYSFSSNDVSNIGTRASDTEFQIARTNVNYSPSRNTDKLTNMPSTSHGYLIPNAISQEPAILATLSNNNPIMDEEMFLNPMNNQVTVSQQGITLVNVENEMFGDSISAANVNLSSLLLTNEEFQHRFLSQNNYDTSNNILWNIDEAAPSSNSDDTLIADVNNFDTGQQAGHRRAKFTVGYESDCNEKTPADSGICTENTSLDRSPDSEIRDINNCKNNNASMTVDQKLNSQNLMAQNSENNLHLDSLRIESNTSWGHLDQNCILSNDNNPRLNNEDKTIIDVSTSQINSSFSSNKGGVDIDVNNYEPEQGVISSYINYSEGSINIQKNEAGPSQTMNPEFVHGSTNTLNIADVCANPTKSCDINVCSNNSESDAIVSVSSVDNSSVIQRTMLDRDVSDVNIVGSESNSNEGISNETTLIQIDASPAIPTIPEEVSGTHNVPSSSGLNSVSTQGTSSSSSTGVLKQRKLRKSSSSSPKNKKKGSRSRGTSREFRVWSPGRFVLENNRPREHHTPLKLNLDQYVDDSVDWNSSQSSATSSFHSECADDEEIALALQAQELAARHHTRAKFSSSEDLIHRLFVCIAGVADQLQTNFASDLRNILKSVFLMNQTPDFEPEPEEKPEETQDDQPGPSTSGTVGDAIEYQASESEVLTNGDSFDSIYSAEEVYADNNSPTIRRSQQSLMGPNGDAGSRISAQSRQNSQKSLDSKKSNGSSDNNDNVSRHSNQEDSRSTHSNSPRATNRKHTSSNSSGSDSGRSQTINCDNSNTNSRIAQTEQRLNNGEFRSNARGQIVSQSSNSNRASGMGIERAPEWVPDIAAPDCMRCGLHFTAFRRRHHCRNCGKVFCASCSSNSIPLPRFGQMKPVRVCEECYQMSNKQNSENNVIAAHDQLSARRQNVR